MTEGRKKGTHPEIQTPAEGSEQEKSFPIVGIGASAGGLAAFEAFFSGMPLDIESDMAFVLVQHLAPDHKSILSDLVKRYTRMQVFEVADGMVVRPNCAYIIPPNRDMAFLNGTLQLLEPGAPRGQRLPIDFFFRSLAQDRREQAICIVLSGTGSDGTQGVRAVKGEGGMAMAQTPESTEYSGMPRSAIATGLVDYVLPPAEMPAQIIAYVGHATNARHRPPVSPASRAEDILKKVFILLRAQTGHDFSLYKKNTVSRRIERRMAVNQIERLDEYVPFLQRTPSEAEALFRDLLIGVTSFFRDPAAFAVLQERVIPRFLADKPAGSWIRVWVPACSTGEEAYSIAILFQEQIEALKLGCRVQMFATDIDRKAVEQARAGVYPASISADISPGRLSGFFSQEPDRSAYRIQKNIRDMVVFSEQDVIKDPPFSKLDLISCRNLLIYMGAELQKRLIPLFHYALNPGGTLFLGTSETVGEFVELFSPLDRAAKLYQRKPDSHGTRPLLPGRLFAPLTSGTGTPSFVRMPAQGRLSVRDLTERALLEQFAPAGALVNERGDILYIHGQAGRYLELAPGEPGMNILAMAREGLRRELTSALSKVVATAEPLERRGVHVMMDGDTIITLAVRPVPGGSSSAGQPGMFLVTMEETPPQDEKLLEPAAAVMPPAGGGAEGALPDSPPGAAPEKPQGAAVHDARIAALEQDLRAKEEYLSSTREELETSNEELMSSNEEMQSVNEELQSTNEELETSKEELQSVNEELATINAELQTRVADLSRANNDMVNLLAGTGIGTIFVDHDLRIMRFTPTVTQVINLIQADLGRPVGHIVSNLAGYDRLVEDVREVLGSLAPKELEVQTKKGVWYLLRIRPYRTIENVIEGAVMTFTDITEMKKAQQSLRETEDMRRLAIAVRDAQDAILVQDLGGRILAWNPAAVKLYGWTEAEALKMNVRDMIPRRFQKEALAMARQLGRGEILKASRAQRISKDGRVVEVWLLATALVNASGEPYAIATTEREQRGDERDSP